MKATKLVMQKPIFTNVSVKMPVIQNAATGILVTAFSPDCRHFHLKHSISDIITNKFKASPSHRSVPKLA